MSEFNSNPPQAPYQRPIPFTPPRKRHTFRTIVLIVGGLFALLIVVAVLTPGSPQSSSNQPAAVTKTAGQIATAMKSRIPQVTVIHVWTPENDPNQLMGRPDQYTTSATLVDKRTTCTDPAPGVDCGATVEVFASASDAATRAAYIDSILTGNTILGVEYHTLVGSALLRVTGKLPPAQNDVYAAAFKDATS